MRVGEQIKQARNIKENELQSFVNELNRELKEKQLTDSKFEIEIKGGKK